MARFVIDPSALVHLAEGDLTVDPGHQLVAPHSVRSRSLDVLLLRVYAGELSEREALELHQRMTEMKIRLLGDRVSRRTAWNLAVGHGWASIDGAEYLAVTQLQADALVALDTDLVAMATGLVPLVPISKLFSS
jgi:hypothetical protein